MGPRLARLAGPMAIGFVAIMAFNLVDTWFVSRLGTIPLAAMGLTFPVVMIVGSVARGLGMGTTSVVSRAIGRAAAHDDLAVRRLTTGALLLGVVVVALVSGLGLATMEPLFRALGADARTLPYVREYMEVWYLGTTFLIVPMVGNSAIRASGDTRTPAAVMVLAGALNAALDPVLIFGAGPIPAMGMRGAAIATVVGRAVTLLIALRVLHRRGMVGWARPSAALRARSGPPLPSLWAAWRRVLAVGVPASAANLAKPVMVGVMTALAARFGPEAVAGMAAGGRVEIFAIIPLMSLGAGLVPFVGQNWGASRRDRVAQGMRWAAKAAGVMGLVGFAVLAGFAEPLGALFTDDPAVLAAAATYLRVMAATHALLGLLVVAAASFNAVGRPLIATSLNGLQALLTWGLATLGASLWGVAGIFAGATVAIGAAGALAWAVAAPLWRSSGR